jgi:thymidylate synthase
MSDRHPEYQYLDLLQEIVEYGTDKGDRTGTGNRYLFAKHMRFSLRDQFPILTTKRVYWRGVVEELLFFLRGDTNSIHLEENKVNIWKGNTRREFLDKKGLTCLPEGEIGTSYSHQWRNFSGEHPLIPATKGMKGFDQVKYVLDMLKTNPLDRRMIISGWAPNQLSTMSLPPCHLIYIFNYNPETNELNCHMTQRSCDTFLGVPFNLSSMALMTYLFAEVSGMKPGEISWLGVDVHLYKDHIEGGMVAEQLTREPRSFPTLNIKKDLTSLEDIENLSFEDLELVGYKPHKTIKAKMAV